MLGFFLENPASVDHSSVRIDLIEVKRADVLLINNKLDQAGVMLARWTLVPMSARFVSPVNLQACGSSPDVFHPDVGIARARRSGRDGPHPRTRSAGLLWYFPTCGDNHRILTNVSVHWKRDLWIIALICIKQIASVRRPC
jgi:hypothetical protein